MDGSILIVDDLADNAALLELALRSGGFHETRVITDPTAVIATCHEIDPDLIILDLRMPVMDGQRTRRV